MLKVLFAGTIVFVVFVVVNRALWLLNQPSDWRVAAGYFLLVALVAVLGGFLSRMVSRWTGRVR